MMTKFVAEVSSLLLILTKIIHTIINISQEEVLTVSQQSLIRIKLIG